MKVISLYGNDFSDCCIKLWSDINNDFKPDLVIEIANGGCFVVDAMPFDENSLPIITVKKQRRLTTWKENKYFSFIVDTLVLLPQALLNILRLIEFKLQLWFTKRKYRKLDYQFNERELKNIKQALNILIVDDAIDTGATIRSVLADVREHASSHATIKVAAVVQTTKSPFIIPDYCAYHSVLVRFPWSKDSR